MKQETMLPPERQPHKFSKEFENWLDDIQDTREDEPIRQVPRPLDQQENW